MHPTPASSSQGQQTGQRGARVQLPEDFLRVLIIISVYQSIYRFTNKCMIILLNFCFLSAQLPKPAVDQGFLEDEQLALMLQVRGELL